MWLDEAQHILLARESGSLSELIYNARYEGHPMLWNFFLFVITRFTDDLLVVQLLHILISSACVYLILKYAPLSFFEKILVCFGYFMLYEYSVLSRNYGLSLLFILLALVNICSTKRNYIYIFSLLALLFNSHLFASVISMVMLVIVWSGFRDQPLKIKTISLIILGSGVTFCLLHLVPPPDHFMNGYNTDKLLSSARFYKTLHSAILGYLPVPDFTYSNYWSNHYLLNHSQTISHWLSLFLFLMPAFLFRKHRDSFFLFYLSALPILTFIYFSPLRVATRHCGFFSILLLVSYWLYKNMKQKPLFKLDPLPLTMERTLSTLYFGILLLSQFFAGILYFRLDLKNDFSNGKKAGEFIDAHVKKQTFITISHFTAGPALKLYTHHKLFYMEPNTFGSFCKWNTHPVFISDSTFLERLDSLLNEKKEIVLVNTTESKMDTLLNRNKVLRIIENFQVAPLKAFKTSTIKSESYFIYSLRSH